MTTKEIKDKIKYHSQQWSYYPNSWIDRMKMVEYQEMLKKIKKQ